tara:strand:- start:53 stop:313 length:261 start_codon:yes stop_codon:yes gene_type:complete
MTCTPDYRLWKDEGLLHESRDKTMPADVEPAYFVSHSGRSLAAQCKQSGGSGLGRLGQLAVAQNEFVDELLREKHSVSVPLDRGQD